MTQEAVMLALLALICFVLALFHVVVGDISLVVLGLAFLAAHFVFPFSVGGWARRP